MPAKAFNSNCPIRFFILLLLFGYGSGFASSKDSLDKSISELQAVLEKADYKKARVAGEKAVKQHPGHAYVHYLLAAAHYGLLDLQAARQTVQLALAIDSNLAPAHALFGRLLIAVDEHADARREIEEALRQNPELAEGYQALAELELSCAFPFGSDVDSAHLGAALSAFQRLEQLNPGSVGKQRQLIEGLKYKLEEVKDPKESGIQGPDPKPGNSARFPPRCMNSGQVTLLVAFNEQGHYSQAILLSGRDQCLIQQGFDAACRMEMIPATKSGKKIPSILPVPVVFN